MNKVGLCGRAIGKAKVRAAGDKKVAEIILAVDRRAAKGEQKADFIRCIGWEKKAEFLERYCDKGTKFIIIGRIQTGSYKDADGKTVYTTDVIIEDIEFAESKRGEEPEKKPSAGTRQYTDADFELIPDDLDVPWA
jgi:single-strand DNA-binding protein